MSSPNVLTPTPQPQDKVFVLEHHQTHRAFMVTDQMLAHPFFRSLLSKGFLKHEITTAVEYDAWAKKILAAEKNRSDEEDYLHACMIDERRKKLREELHARLLIADSPQERQVIQATLNALEIIRQQKERVRDSFFMRQAFEAKKSDAAEQVVTDIITNRNV